MMKVMYMVDLCIKYNSQQKFSAIPSLGQILFDDSVNVIILMFVYETHLK